MEDSEANDVCAETLAEQFTTVQQLTKDSHVIEYGFTGFKNEPIGNFQGTCDSKSSIRTFLRGVNTRVQPTKEYAAIDSRFAKLDYLYNKYMRTQAQEDANELEKELKNRRRIEQKFGSLRSQVNFELGQKQEISNWDCYKKLIESHDSS
mmetsp:Transcript_25774/g.29680  ORF Transcript_25774/g.29680 Transcript_25774/m.29680 type:complete len:150 (+) Transcript_25774:692-1141(+)